MKKTVSILMVLAVLMTVFTLPMKASAFYRENEALQATGADAIVAKYRGLGTACCRRKSSETYLTEGYFKYQVFDNEAIICGTTPNGALPLYGPLPDVDTLVIPSELGGYPVTSICDRAFYVEDDSSNYLYVWWTSLRCVIIPSSVKYIGEDAFHSYGYYEYVQKKEPEVVKIGDLDFDPDKAMTVVAEDAFGERLKSLELGNNVLFFGSAIYRWGFDRLVLPESLRCFNTSWLYAAEDEGRIKELVVSAGAQTYDRVFECGAENLFLPNSFPCGEVEAFGWCPNDTIYIYDNNPVKALFDAANAEMLNAYDEESGTYIHWYNDGNYTYTIHSQDLSDYYYNYVTIPNPYTTNYVIDDAAQTISGVIDGTTKAEFLENFRVDDDHEVVVTDEVITNGTRVRVYNKNYDWLMGSYKVVATAPPDVLWAGYETDLADSGISCIADGAPLSVPAQNGTALVLTKGNPSKIQFAIGQTTCTFSRTSGAVQSITPVTANGEAASLWAIRYQMKETDYTVRAKYGLHWSETPDYTLSILSRDPVKEVSIAEGETLAYSRNKTAFTITTSTDVTKVQLVSSSGATMTCNNGFTDDNGVRTWTINKAFSKGAQSYTIRVKSAAGWQDSAVTLSFTVA